MIVIMASERAAEEREGDEIYISFSFLSFFSFNLEFFDFFPVLFFWVICVLSFLLLSPPPTENSLQ